MNSYKRVKVSVTDQFQDLTGLKDCLVGLLKTNLIIVEFTRNSDKTVTEWNLERNSWKFINHEKNHTG